MSKSLQENTMFSLQTDYDDMVPCVSVTLIKLIILSEHIPMIFVEFQNYICKKLMDRV